VGQGFQFPRRRAAQPFTYICNPTHTTVEDYAPVELALAPGSAQQVGARSYPAGQHATFTVRGTLSTVGTPCRAA
jgi:hypothetical protein